MGFFHLHLHLTGLDSFSFWENLWFSKYFYQFFFSVFLEIFFCIFEEFFLGFLGFFLYFFLEIFLLFWFESSKNDALGCFSLQWMCWWWWWRPSQARGCPWEDEEDEEQAWWKHREQPNFFYLSENIKQFWETCLVTWVTFCSWCSSCSSNPLFLENIFNLDVVFENCYEKQFLLFSETKLYLGIGFENSFCFCFFFKKTCLVELIIFFLDQVK